MVSMIYDNYCKGALVPKSYDFYGKDNESVVKVNFAGTDPSLIDVSIKGDTVLIESRSAKDDKVERFYKFYIPNDVDVEKISAEYKYGIIEVTLPKKQKVSIPINIRTE